MIFKRKLEQLDREIEALQAAADRTGEAAARGKKIIYYLLSGKLSAALKESAKVTALTTAPEGQYDALAEQLYSQATQLSKVPNQERGAIDAFNKAAATFHVLGDEFGEANALKAQAELELSIDELRDALRHLDKAIALFDESAAKHLDLLAELYQLRGRAYARQGQPEPAWENMDKALILAQKHGDRLIIRKIQNERHTLPNYQRANSGSE